MSKPLEGVKVIELATFIAAATAGRFMADLGADVIKIESAKGDPLRYTAPSEGRPLDMYENTTWDLENGNKRCISLNMKTPEGKEAFFKLLDSADVLITNWRVQALQRAGLDYETLKERIRSWFMQSVPVMVSMVRIRIFRDLTLPHSLQEADTLRLCVREAMFRLTVHLVSVTTT